MIAKDPAMYGKCHWKNVIILLVCIVLSGAARVKGEIHLPAVIADHMVLQQQSEVALWGKANPNTKVSITPSWDHKLYTVQSGADGVWRIKVRTPAAGGPYTIMLTDGQKLVLQDILIGEVWLCSGQSNMEMPIKGFNNQPVLGSGKLLLDADNAQIRLFRLERAMSRNPEADCKATPWEDASAMSVKEFSAVGYLYAKLLQEQLKVPVGIIESTWGGTMIEAWMDKSCLGNFPTIKVLEPADTTKMGKNEPTVLYNAMVNPIAGYGIKGVIWYQGEQNRGNAALYDKLMQSMVQEWRSIWKCGEWPFYYVQIAPYGYHDQLGPAAPLREAQGRALHLLSNTGMVVSMDVGEEKSIHPADKLTISERLAYWALAGTYGRKGLPYASPEYSGMKVVGHVANISFDNAPNGLTALGKELLAFEIAGEDKRFFPAKAKITGKGIAVESDSVLAPVAVRYAYKDWVVGDLYNTEGLPAAPFRTDNW